MTGKIFNSTLIRAGHAAPAKVAGFAASGEHVALTERNYMDGTCVNTVCMPTSTLVASVKAGWLPREGEWLGILTGRLTVDAAGVLAGKDAVVGTARSNLTRWMKNTAGTTVISGHARSTELRKVTVEETHLQAARIFVDVGAKATVPPVKELQTVARLTDADVMDLDVVPDRLVTPGGSYISLESAQIFCRFRAELTIPEAAPEFLDREDADVAQPAAFRGPRSSGSNATKRCSVPVLWIDESLSTNGLSQTPPCLVRNATGCPRVWPLPRWAGHRSIRC